MAPPKPKNRDKLASDVATYLQQVARKAQKGKEPNDRRYDRDVERKLKGMSPTTIDALTRTEDEDE